MFAFLPLSFVVLALILPDIYSIPIEVVFNEFPFVPMAAFLKYENTETMHYLWSWLIYLKVGAFLGQHGTRVRIGPLNLTNIVSLSLFKSNFLYQRLVEDSPYFPILVVNAHILVVLSEDYVKFL
jgi:hypothetical protein